MAAAGGKSAFIHSASGCASLPEEVRSRMGFDMDYDGALGFYDKSILLEGAPRLEAKDLS